MKDDELIKWNIFAAAFFVWMEIKVKETTENYFQFHFVDNFLRKSFIIALLTNQTDWFDLILMKKMRYPDEKRKRIKLSFLFDFKSVDCKILSLFSSLSIWQS